MKSCALPSHHNALLLLEAAKGHRLVVLVHEAEVRRRLANRHHSKRRRANTLTKRMKSTYTLAYQMHVLVPACACAGLSDCAMKKHNQNVIVPPLLHVLRNGREGDRNKAIANRSQEQNAHSMTGIDVRSTLS